MANTFSQTGIRFTADDSALGAQLAKVEGAIHSSTDRMASLVGRSMGSVVGLAGAWLSVGKAVESIEMGAKAQQAEESFKLVADSSGIAADALLANLTRAAAGTVDDSDIMQEAVKGMVLGLQDTQLVGIMETARIAARYAGTDVKTAFEDITTAIGTDMPRALKQYGLITREETKQIQEAISAGAKDIDLYSIAMAHAAVNTAKFADAQTNAAEQIQALKVVANEAQETMGKWLLGFGKTLTAGMLGIDAFATRAAAGMAALAGKTETHAELMAAADEMTKKRNALLGIQTEEEKKAAERSKTAAAGKLKEAEAALKAQQAKLKDAAETAKIAESTKKAQEQELKGAVEGAEKELALAAKVNEYENVSLAEGVKANQQAADQEIAFWVAKADAQIDEDFKAAQAVAQNYEDYWKKKDEITKRHQPAAVSTLEEAKRHMEERGVDTSYVTAADIDREMQLINQERAQKALEAQRFGAGGGASMEETIANFKAVGELTAAQLQRKELGTTGEILTGGAKVGAGALTESLGAIGAQISNPDYWNTAYTSFDTFATKIVVRANEMGSQLAKTVYGNVEEWFVRKLMEQGDRN